MSTLKINSSDGREIWFTSDTHYGHANICSATSEWKDTTSTRKFNSLDHMNRTLVDRINEVVREDDILIHLGDWSFGGFERIAEFRSGLVCKNIHLVLGNHDHHIERDKGGVRSLFTSVHQYLHLQIRNPNGGEKNVICMHYPIASWDGMSKGWIHLHGHVHLNGRDRLAAGRAMDVGVDGNDLRPWSWRKIERIMWDRPIKSLSLPSDHHENSMK